MRFSSGLYVGILVVAGCGGSEQPAASPACPAGQVFDGRYCQMAPATGGSGNVAIGAAGAGTVTPTPTPTPTGAPLGVATASCANPATAIDASAAQAATSLLPALAGSKAMAGAKAVGAPIAAQFQPGQCLEVTVNMNPGKCYSVVGAALPTVQNLDLSLVAAATLPGLPQVVAASDSTVGPTSTLGESPNCFKWALPVAGTMKLIVSVSAGQGLAAAQVFEK